MSNQNSKYLESLVATIATSEEMLKRLKTRNEMLAEREKAPEGFSAYDLNEFGILRIKTQGEIDVLEKVIKEKKDYFEKYAEEYKKDLAETREKYADLVAFAKTKINSNKAINHALTSVKWDIQEKDEDARVFFYKRLRDIISKEKLK